MENKKPSVAIIILYLTLTKPFMSAERTEGMETNCSAVSKKSLCSDSLSLGVAGPASVIHNSKKKPKKTTTNEDYSSLICAGWLSPAPIHHPTTAHQQQQQVHLELRQWGLCGCALNERPPCVEGASTVTVMIYSPATVTWFGVQRGPEPARDSRRGSRLSSSRGAACR